MTQSQPDGAARGEQSGSVIWRLFVAQKERNIGSALTNLAEDFIFEDVSIGTFIRSRKQFGYVLSSLFGAFPDATLDVTSVIETTDGGAVEWTFKGTQMGPFSGFRESHKQILCRGASVLVLKGGLVAKRTDYWDIMTALRNVAMTK